MPAWLPGMYYAAPPVRAHVEPLALSTIHTGDARALGQRVADHSIDLIFTDPVYDRPDDYEWLSAWGARVLKDDSPCLVWCGIGELPRALPALSTSLQYRWTFASVMPVGKKGAFAQYQMFSNWRCLLWFEKGTSKAQQYFSDVSFESDNRYNGLMGWGKSIVTTSWWLNALSAPDALIADPFCGGGTVAAVCKMLGRRWLAFEIDAERADKARERVQQTQAPLFVVPSQTRMELPA